MAEIVWGEGLTEKEVSLWLAALLDGEGTIFVEYSENLCFRLKVDIAQTHCDELLYKVKAAVGFGSVTPGDRWRCVSNQASQFLRRVQPYLIVKRYRCNLALAIQETCGVRGQHISDRNLILRKKLLEAWELTRRSYGEKAPSQLDSL